MVNNCWYCRKGGLVDLYFAGRTGVCPSCGSGVNVKFDVEKFVTIDEIVNALDRWAKSVCSESNEPLTMAQLKALPDGTAVYCYVLVDGRLTPDPTKVCRTIDSKRKWVKREKDFHYEFKNIAVDSEQNTSNRRCFLKEVDLNNQLEYKVGDHVIVTSSNIGDRYNGKSGVITDIDFTYEYPYCVKLDDGSYTDLWVTVTVDDNKPLTLEELKQMDGQKVWLSRFVNGVEQFGGEPTCGWWTVDAKNAQLNQIGSNSWDRIGSIGTRFGFNAYRTDQSHRANVDNEEEIPF